MEGFLPVSRADMKACGWDQLDFVFVSGDAYVDHPSFGPAIICRVLESHGYKVGIIPQPDWRSVRDFSRLGKPRLGFPFLEELCRHHISGQLKIAPEHISDRVTRLMGKSNKKTYLTFVKRFASINARLGKRQYLVPYFLSSHPGAELEDAVELAVFLHEMGYHPEQVQDFIPTPGALATCMYYTGLDPLTGEHVYTAKSREEKGMQRALMQYWLPQNREIVRKALRLAHREDLIGYGSKCLVCPADTHPKRKRQKPRKKVQL